MGISKMTGKNLLLACPSGNICRDYLDALNLLKWYYNGIAGIQSQEPGFGNIVIRPYLPEGMKEFSCCYHSVKGEICVEVKTVPGNIGLKIKVLNKMKCQICTDNLETEGRDVTVTVE